MNGNNSTTHEGFIKALGHPRKQELAEMIIAGADVAAMKEAGFGRINILEMARTIKESVEGMEGLDIDIPRTEGDDEPVDEDADETATETEALVEETANTSAPVSSDNVPTPTATPVVPDATVTEPVIPTEPTAPTAPTA